jgi:hypothetical protein
MCSNNDLIFLALFTIFVILCIKNPNTFEGYTGWSMYKQKPLNYIKTGSTPLGFYERPRYRKPYRYPFQFEKSYPIRHMSYHE